MHIAAIFIIATLRLHKQRILSQARSKLSTALYLTMLTSRAFVMVGIILEYVRALAGPLSSDYGFRFANTARLYPQGEGASLQALSEAYVCVIGCIQFSLQFSSNAMMYFFSSHSSLFPAVSGGLPL